MFDNYLVMGYNLVSALWIYNLNKEINKNISKIQEIKNLKILTPKKINEDGERKLK